MGSKSSSCGRGRVTSSSKSLRGIRVLVTRASTGVGEQTAYHYARFSAQIIVTARRKKVLQQVVEKCLTLGVQKDFYISGDMATESEPDTVVEFALEKLGGLDYWLLIPLCAFPKVNFFSHVQMAWKALPSLERSKGSLVVVSCLLGKVPGPFTAPYTSTKCALDGFFGSLHHELEMKNSNVSVSLCTLGLIDTDSALAAIKGIVTNVPASPASEAALNIIKTGATRQAELCYSRKTFIIALIKDWSFTKQVTL